MGCVSKMPNWYFLDNDDKTEGVVSRCGEGRIVCASRDRRGRVILA